MLFSLPVVWSPPWRRPIAAASGSRTVPTSTLPRFWREGLLQRAACRRLPLPPANGVTAIVWRRRCRRLGPACGPLRPWTVFRTRPAQPVAPCHACCPCVSVAAVVRRRRRRQQRQLQQQLGGALGALPKLPRHSSGSSALCATSYIRCTGTRRLFQVQTGRPGARFVRRKLRKTTARRCLLRRCRRLQTSLCLCCGAKS